MAIVFNCPGCGKRLRVPDEKAGRRGRCPSCGESTLVPDVEPVPTSDLPAAATAPISMPVDSQDGGSNDYPTDTPAVSRTVAHTGVTELQTADQTVAGVDDATAVRGTPHTLADNLPDDLDEEAAPAPRRSRRAARDAGTDAPKKKGGVFLWVMFGLLLAVVHTAAAVLLGAWLALGYAEDPEAHPYMAPPAQLLELDERIERLKGSDADVAADADGSGE